MRKLPPLRALQAFEAFGRIGSMTKAASELGVTKGAVSLQIRRLEESIGMRLCERNGRAAELTAWGRIYHVQLQLAFDQLQQAQDTLLRLRNDSGLVVSCPPSLASKWIGPRLVDWQMARPGARVELVGTGAEPQRSDKPVDFHISYGSPSRSFEQYTELFNDWAVPACAPSLLADTPLAAPMDILAQPLLGIDWGRGNSLPPRWQDWAAMYGTGRETIAVNFAFSISSAAIDAAIQGRGFILGQMSLIEDDVAAGRLVIPFDLRVGLSEPYFLAWDRAVLDKPYGPELRAWMVSLGRRQTRSTGKAVRSGIA